jgi:hypothetical protein
MNSKSPITPQPDTDLVLSRESRVTVPLALLAMILAAAAVGYAKWTGTEAQVQRNTEDIKTLNSEVRSMRDTLSEIRGDVKYLVRGSRNQPANP